MNIHGSGERLLLLEQLLKEIATVKRSRTINAKNWVTFNVPVALANKLDAHVDCVATEGNLFQQRNKTL